MHAQGIKRGSWKTLFTGGLVLVLAVPSAFGQSDGWVPAHPSSDSPPPCLAPAPLPLPMGPPAPLPVPAVSSAQPPAPAPLPAPVVAPPAQPLAPLPAPVAPPAQPLAPLPAPAVPHAHLAAPAPPPAPAMPPPEPLPSLAPESGLAFGGQTVAVAPGYIDDAAIHSLFRLRYDDAYNDNRPDRAEFFYPKTGLFPGGPGPKLGETRIDYQEVSGYLEWAVSKRFSGFIEVPARFLNAEQNRDASGFGDLNAGFKAALWNRPDQILTFQLRTYIPTGDGVRGLGTEHVSLEPALLGYLRLTDRLQVHSELRDWIPIGGTDFAGNIIRYGVGVSWNAYHKGYLWVAPITEFVGWTVLGGKEFDAVQNEVLQAAGDTIVNAKFGVRVGWGGDSDIYVGYGRALTGDVWYKDILRVEYRLRF